MRDAMFFFQLGFEHGYAGQDRSYPGNPAYDKGHEAGGVFRSWVHDLVPTVERSGKGLSVVFRYALNGVTVPEIEAAAPGMVDP
jgi:hypothetical protein